MSSQWKLDKGIVFLSTKCVTVTTEGYCLKLYGKVRHMKQEKGRKKEGKRMEERKKEWMKEWMNERKRERKKELIKN